MSVSTMNSVAESKEPETLRQSLLYTLPRQSVPVLFVLASVLLVVSIRQPYWEMHLDAPQYDYRNGLDIIVYVDSMTGKDPEFDELRELNGLNHYIGMRHLDDAAVFERSIAIPTVIIFIAILLANAFAFARKLKWRRWVWILTFAPLSFPYVFAGDLYYWLRDSGQNLDPAAPLSSTIKPFTPRMIGAGEVGQFTTDAAFGVGWYLIFVASLFILAALIFVLWQSFRSRAERTE